MDGDVHAPFVFLNSSYLFSILQKKKYKIVTLDPRHGTLDMEPSTLDPRQKDRLVSGQGTSAEQCDEKPTIAGATAPDCSLEV